jgi:GT2 family glycosyltransferase
VRLDTVTLPSVSVVVPTFERCAQLRVTLPRILTDDATTDLVVVIDGPDDGTTALLTELAARDGRVRHVVAPGKGAAAARQTGLEAATGEVVVFLDDDVVPEPGLVSGHARHHAAAEGLVVVGYMPVVRPVRREPGQFGTYLYAVEYDGRVQQYEQEPTSILHHLWTGNFSMRRVDALRVGIFEPFFSRLYHEDRELGLRCAAAGLTGVFDRSLLARHQHSRSLSAFVRDARSQGAARRALHERYPDELGPLPGDEFTRGLPVPAAAVVRLARREGPGRAVAGLLPRVVTAAGKAHAYPIEEAVAKLLRRVEQQRGALGAGEIARHASPAAPPAPDDRR